MPLLEKELLFALVTVTFDPPRALRRDGTEGVSIEQGRLVGEGEPLLRPLLSLGRAVCQFSEEEEEEESVEEAPPPNAPADFLFVPRWV